MQTLHMTSPFLTNQHRPHITTVQNHGSTERRQLNRVQFGATKCDLNAIKSPINIKLGSVDPRFDWRWCNGS